MSWWSTLNQTQDTTQNVAVTDATLYTQGQYNQQAQGYHTNYNQNIQDAINSYYTLAHQSSYDRLDETGKETVKRLLARQELSEYSEEELERELKERKIKKLQMPKRCD